MKVARLRLLLGVWVVCLVVPGFVATTAYHLDTDGVLGGGAALIWVGGYLLQFGVFMGVARTAGTPTVLGWLTASLLPWVCDWACPSAVWAAAPCAAVAAAVAYRVYAKAIGTDQLERNGVPATGTVLEVVKPRWNVVINNVYIRRTLRLRVTFADGRAPYEARLKGLFMLGEIPDVGDRLRLQVDPTNPKRLMRVDPSADAASVNASSDWLPTHEPDGIADELAKLDKLHRSGGLSDTEFEQAKARVLDR